MTIPITQNSPPPTGRQAIHGDLHDLRQAISSLQPNQAFVWHGQFHSIYRAAKQLGASITTRKLPAGGRSVWRIS